MFSSSSQLSPQWHIPTNLTLTTDQKQTLDNPISTSETDLALQNMAPLKAPSPYEFSTIFFHSNWDIIKIDVYSLISHYFSYPAAIKPFNQIIITLIPKSKHPVHVSD